MISSGCLGLPPTSPYRRVPQLPCAVLRSAGHSPFWHIPCPTPQLISCFPHRHTLTGRQSSMNF